MLESESWVLWETKLILFPKEIASNYNCIVQYITMANYINQFINWLIFISLPDLFSRWLERMNDSDANFFAVLGLFSESIDGFDFL